MKASSILDVEEITEEIKKAALESTTEEDLRINVEYVIKSKIIEKIKELEKTEIPYASWKPPKAKYEVTLVSGVRVDALYGHLIIEYEKPKTFESRSGFEHAVEQVKEYIVTHANGNEVRFPRYFGVVLDGYKIGFVRYREANKNFESKGPFEVNKNTVAKLVEAIIGLRRKALSAEELLKDFGPESQVAKDTINGLYDKLLGTTSRTQMLFEDWRRVFSQVCAYSPEKMKGLGEIYGLKEKNPEKLLFALHTYYALIMKLLAAEVAALYMAPKLWSYLRTLEDAYYRGHEELKEELKELEEGGIFTKLGITNFLEADYFSWYLDEWDENIAKKVIEVVNNLSNYDPSVAELEPDKIRDLFKRLYQNLVPKKVRHDLGEYYTPDWLAELVLNEVGWSLETFEKKAQEKNDSLAPLDLRLLDPACGSGTFLVLAISRLRSYIEEHWIDKRTALGKIIKNIVGFDLNPLAVITSRTNYLIALGDMLRERGNEPIEIPIYLADSILVERRGTITAVKYVLKTVAGEFMVPISIVEKGLLAKVLSVVEECIGREYQLSVFEARLSREVKLEEDEILAILNLYSTLLKLEREGKNKIWTRVLKNSFAPFFAGKFDYVVGNPPWVKWENLAEDFRKTLKELYRWYDILPGNPNAQTNVDLSMIFAYRCMDRYLKDKGMFGFLINDAAFKAMAGNGFRKFRIKGIPFKVRAIHDLVAIKPFEGASNRTAMFIAKKNEATEFPIPYRKWFKLVREEIPQNLALNEVIKMVKIIDFYAEPLGGYKSYGEVLPLVTFLHKDTFNKLNRIVGRSAYKAHEGPVLIPSGVYRIQLIEKHSTLSVIRNLAERDRKFGSKEQIISVENELIYPILESGNVSKWLIIPKNFAIIPYNSRAQIYSESELKVKYPNAFAYFSTFKDALTNRSHYRKYGENKPFYFIHMFSDWMLSNYKVVWNQMGNQLEVAVATPVDDAHLGLKPLIPEHVIAFIPVEQEDEAHYICSILNSNLVNLILQSIAKGGKNFATPELINMVNIRRYNSSDPLHKKLVELSKRAHQLAQQNQEDELKKVEEEIDKTVSQLYGITDEEFEEIKNCLAILEGKEIEKEIPEEIPALEPDITLENSVIEENTPSILEIVVRNPLEKSISNIKVKVQLLTETVERFFSNLEKEKKIQVKVDGLKKGEYEIKLTMDYSIEGSLKKIQKSLTLFVKGKGEKKTIKRKSIGEIFGE
ncbi:MAG: Eco57I restriction-modification methylase domain-containing protein [Thermoproteota archaeon]